MIRTNAFSLLTVLVRGVAVYSLCHALLAFTTGLLTFDLGDEFSWGKQSALLGILFAIFGALWLFADVLVRLTLANPRGVAFESELGPDIWQEIFFSVIGIWLAAQAVVRLAIEASSWYYLTTSNLDFVSSELKQQLFSHVVGDLVQLVLGLWLLLGARGLTRWVRRLRGREPVSSPD